MAEAAVSVAVRAIGNLLSEEMKFLHAVSDEVGQLQRELELLQSLLKDADARQYEEERVKVWISHARDLAYEANDLIESYAFKVASRRRKGIRGITKRCIGISSEGYARHTIGTGIQTLKTKISELTECFQKYGIRAVMERQDGAGLSHQQWRRTYSHVVEDDFVGLEEDVEMLVKHLLRGSDHETDQCFRVVSTCGMGGLGKTTLARKVYNHPEVRRWFDGLAWVSVSQNWKKEVILQQILLRLIPEKKEEIEKKWGDAELVRQLFRIQQKEKCLVVLDDIWSTDAWDCIKDAFPIRNNGSKILVTTRNEDVALHIDPSGFHHQQRFLSEVESWQLLQRKALWDRFRGEHEDVQKLMENLGKEMGKACGGLPLAVIVLGGTLAIKKNLREWETVNNNIKAYLGRGKNMIQEEGILHKILALSYSDLPYKLKPCFLYLSRYEEDADIDTEELYKLWMAEGIISTKDRMGEESMMDVGERYLGELVTRCMVQGKAPDDDDDVVLSSIGRSFAWCRLHDLMRDLCLLKAKEENFLVSIRYHGNGDLKKHMDTSSLADDDQSKVYRLVIRFSAEDARKYNPPGEKRNTRHLRSLALLVNGSYEGHLLKKMKSHLNQSKMLRVLAIEGPLDYLRLPKAVGKLIHLRHLSLRGSDFFCLPSSLGNLLNLQTLDLRDSFVLRIPNVLWKMRQLRYLYLPEGYNIWDMCKVGKCKLNLFCKKLRLKGLDKLEILENFCPPFCSSQDISTLKNLRVLSAEVQLDEGFPVEIHRLMSNSDRVCITSLALFSHEHSEANKKLMSDVVGQCFSSRNLHALEVRSPMANFPKYEAQYMYASLLKLTLYHIEMEEAHMQTLEMLPNLQSLLLGYGTFLDKEMRCKATGFGQLRILRLISLYNLEKWNVEEGAMPNLSVLTIVHCPKLEMVPNGLRFIKSLKKLNILQMPKEFTDRIQATNGEDHGQDFDKVSHIPSIIIRDYGYD